MTTGTTIGTTVGTAIRNWVRALRLHQWLKNLLVVLPALLAHRLLEPALSLRVGAAFVAFSFAASAAYVVNDLKDVGADRAHPRKRSRPFASGALSRAEGLFAVAVLLAGALLVGARLGGACLALIACYFLTSVSYSVWIKRIVVADVMTLAGLYTLRILAGGVAAGVETSFWLLAFSMFFFLSLAIVKRLAELGGTTVPESGLLPGRGYARGDMAVLMSLGPVAGYLAVLVVALYIDSPESVVRYAHPRVLWAVCPLVLYWITRVWVLTARGLMHDDPVVFAVTDAVSLCIGGLIVAIGALAA